MELGGGKLCYETKKYVAIVDSIHYGRNNNYSILFTFRLDCIRYRLIEIGYFLESGGFFRNVPTEGWVIARIVWLALTVYFEMIVSEV